MKKLCVLFCFISISVFAQKPELIIPSNHSVRIANMAVTPDGKLLITSSADGNLKIWDIRSRKLIKDITFPVRDMVFSKDGTRLLASAEEGKALDLKTFAISKIPTTYFSTQIDQERNYAYSTKREFKASSMYVEKLDMSTGVSTTILTIPQQNVLAVASYYRNAAIAPNNEILAVPQGWSNTVHLVRLQDNSIIGEIQLQSELYWLTSNILIGIEGNKTNTSYKITAKNLQDKTLWVQEKNNIEHASISEKRMVIDHTTGIFYFIQDDGIYQGNKEGEITKLANHNKKYPSVLTRLDANTLVFADTEDQSIYTLDLKSKEIELFSKNFSVVTPTFISGSVDGYKLFVTNREGNAAVIQLDPQQLLISDIYNKIKAAEIIIDDSGEKVIVNELNITNYYYGARVSGYNFVRLTNTKASGTQLTFSKDATLLGTNNYGKTVIYSFLSNKDIFTKTQPNKFADTGTNIAISPDNKKVVFMEMGLKVENGKEVPDEHIYCYDINSGKQLWSMPGKSNNLFFSSNSAQVMVVESFPLKISYYNSENGSKIKTVGNESLNIKSSTTKLNSDLSLMAFSSFDTKDISIVDPNTGKLVRYLKGSEVSPNQIAFLKDDFLVSAGADSKLLLWDAVTGKKLARIIVLQDTGDWVLLAEDGRFDASQGALSKMYYTIGNKTVSLEQLYEGFYTPSLLAQLMDRKSNPKPLPIDIDDVKVPPTVVISYKSGNRNLTVEDDDAIQEINTTIASAKINIKATAPNDKVEEIRLYHNGKLINNKSRNLTVEDDVKDSGSEKMYEVTLVAGNNTFKAIALNSQRTESAPALLNIILESDKTAVIPSSSGMQLYLMVVGINEYKNPKYNLNYAVADATSFKEAIQKGMASITSKVNVHYISNSEASRGKIFATMQAIADIANPQDIFVFYYAGHGMMSEEVKPDFYLVPYDVTQIYGDDDGIKKKGISATELKKVASTIKAQKQLYVLDACQSAGALSSIASRGAGEEKAIAQLARSTGTHWLTASGSQQFATEFDQLGHGIFTYVFLDALKGKADSGDGRITVNEIKAYLESQVPELSQKYNGNPQYPASFGFGQDFPVGVKN